MAKISTLVDPFNASSSRAKIWGNSSTGSYTPVIAGGYATVIEDDDYAVLASTAQYDLTSSAIYAQIIPTQGTDYQFSILLQASGSASNEIVFSYANGSITNLVVTGGTAAFGSNITYSATNHLWWQIINTSGSTVLLQTAPDGVTWTTQWTITPTFALTSLSVVFQGGFYGTGTPSGSGAVCCLNVPAVNLFSSYNVATAVASPIASFYSTNGGTATGSIVTTETTLAPSALKYVSTNATAVGVYPNVFSTYAPVVVGQNYVAEVSMQLASGNTTLTSGLCQITWYTSGNAYISNTQGTSSAGSSTTSKIYSVSAVAPATAAFAIAQFVSGSIATGDGFYVSLFAVYPSKSVPTAFVAPVVFGSAPATLGNVGVASGTPTIAGATGTGSLTTVGAATGSGGGTASGVLGATAAASGAPALSGTATGAVSAVGTASGSPKISGTATGAMGTAGSSIGVDAEQASGTGTGALAATAWSSGGPSGTAAGATSLAATASGKPAITGTGTAVFGNAGSSTGSSLELASGTASEVLTLVAAEIGSVLGTAAASVSLTAAATGSPHMTGTGSGSFAGASAASNSSETVFVTAAALVSAIAGVIGSGRGTGVGSGSLNAVVVGSSNVAITLAAVASVIATALGTGNGIGTAVANLQALATGVAFFPSTGTGSMSLVATATGDPKIMGQGEAVGSAGLVATCTGSPRFFGGGGAVLGVSDGALATPHLVGSLQAATAHATALAQGGPSGTGHGTATAVAAASGGPRGTGSAAASLVAHSSPGPNHGLFAVAALMAAINQSLVTIVVVPFQFQMGTEILSEWQADEIVQTWRVLPPTKET
jgi:hypothetical protein